MTQASDPSGGADQPGAASSAASPYERLGIAPDASFDAVQAAKQQCLEAVGDDPQARARIEAAYDAVLMDRLKERQQGKVSSAALNASQREAARPPAAAPPALPSLPALPRPVLQGARLALPSLNLSLVEGRPRWITLAGAAVLLAGLLLAPASAELVLAAATVLTVLMLQRRQGRLLVSVGWSLLLLSAGLLLGGLLLQVIDPSLPLGLPLSPQQVQSLPALLLLALGALLIG